MTDYIKHLTSEGYAYIPGEYYKALNKIYGSGERDYLQELKNGYNNLILDPYSLGNRWRGYAQFRRLEDGTLIFGHFTPYKQTKKYNPDTGDIVRNYPLLPNSITENAILQSLLKDDIIFVEKYGKIGNLEDLTLGIHLFRYQAKFDSPAYSSPVWLHKDDEDVVFVHLINASFNMLGGDSIIASNPKKIEKVLRLEKPFDTLVVNHDKYHAVTPVGCSINGEIAIRDIILVTFHKING
ncbi:2OG-Fe dioxygenase family protein [Xenorhabdus bovienii]|uniref:3(1)-hydroxy-L-isoleucine 4-dioxygenase HilB n=1 Tax=Xenorhabdus bovienii TaxID=40576 RepID=UPI0023B24C3A|nr:3(1)-hydroxy-L-isoleucine 4-dioxygenase HilB [Xenorhabdus bovienii]MDE9481566.1 2OG-Fe dioxygenase family protein [Xenorhabdus bovienii]MDE9542178.1 2OG-Fe dioxygenase family protein [Xenorhabdus bovienii]MDE9555075.1 2OG-Fe dioxygenase family protein [Xenorhabdus bovienii]MDE9564579.1 2OG-Fe dioxygenase family protein [Xenorhabdus bovienii]